VGVGIVKNKLSDLNNHLFAQLERLNDEQLEGEALDSEINRSKAVAGVAGQIIANANTALRAAEYKANYGSDAPVLIEDKRSA